MYKGVSKQVTGEDRVTCGFWKWTGELRTMKNGTAILLFDGWVDVQAFDDKVPAAVEGKIVKVPNFTVLTNFPGIYGDLSALSVEETDSFLKDGTLVPVT